MAAGRRLGWGGLLVTLVSVAGLGATEPADWQRLVHLLQYLAADYPLAVRTHDPSELEEQRGLAREAEAALQRLGPAGDPFQMELRGITEEIAHGKDPEGVRRRLGGLVEQLATAGHLARRPRTTPSLEEGRQLYAANCSSCHGAEGQGDGPAAAALRPPPANFRSQEAGELTPYRIFNTIAFGIPGTAMVSFGALSEDQRWALAFYVSALRQPPCQGNHPKVSLEELANRTDAELAQHYGASVVRCLRHNLAPASTATGLSLARRHLEHARELGRNGDLTAARQAVVDAYLEGMEPVEPRLRAQSPARVAQLEAAFLRTRVATEHNAPEFDREAAALILSLEDAEAASAPGGSAARFTSVFWLALLVVVREGFEATLVVAALLAVLRKMGQEGHARLVHVGWTSALVAGAISYWVGQRLLAGANREWMEGVVALVAVGMLLYAAFWLNKRANISRHMGDLRTRMQGALGSGSAIGLFLIAFSAVFRECFETALFLQGLSLDSRAGALWGALGGLATMGALVLLIRRVGYRLPMQPLFKASTVLLVVTAVILLGEGIHALQEVGALPLRPVPFITFAPLGIFPDAVSLVPQLLVALAPFIAWLAVGRASLEARS